MSRKTLTVIVPTYNMEEYLGRGLGSVCLPGLENDLEVIVVNDGSTDASLSIATDCSRAFPDMVAVIDKPNAHYGSCVNAGLKVATGTYVSVLDADDCLNAEGLRALVETLRDACEDMVIHDIRMVDMKGALVRTIGCPLEEGRSYGVDALWDVPELWGHMVSYRTENLRKAGYHQTEGIHYTDQEWLFFPVTTVKTLRYLEKVVYDYTVGRAGQSVDPVVFWAHIDDEITGLKTQIRQYMGMEHLDRSLDRYLLMRLRTRMGTVYSQLLIYHLDARSLRKARDLDSWLHGISPALWRLAGYLDAPVAALHLKYVRSWRRHRCRPDLPCRVLHTYKELRRRVWKAPGTL